MKFANFKGIKYPALLKTEYIDPRYSEVVETGETISLFKDKPTGIFYLAVPKEIYDILPEQEDSEELAAALDEMAIINCHRNPRGTSCKDCSFRNGSGCQQRADARRLLYVGYRRIQDELAETVNSAMTAIGNAVTSTINQYFYSGDKSKLAPGYVSNSDLSAFSVDLTVAINKELDKFYNKL